MDNPFTTDEWRAAVKAPVPMLDLACLAAAHEQDVPVRERAGRWARNVANQLTESGGYAEYLAEQITEEVCDGEVLTEVIDHPENYVWPTGVDERSDRLAWEAITVLEQARMMDERDWERDRDEGLADAEADRRYDASRGN